MSAASNSSPPTLANRQRIRERARRAEKAWAHQDMPAFYGAASVLAEADVPALLEALEAVERERDEWVERAGRAEARFPEQNSALLAEVLRLQAELALLRHLVEAAKRAVERYDRADAAQKGQGFVRAGIAEAMVDDLRTALAQVHFQDPEERT